jgi:hypothetical protein
VILETDEIEQLRVERDEFVERDGKGRRVGLGSFTVTCTSMRPKLTRRNRSVMVAALVSGLPFRSSQISSRKPFVSTTSVSCSQRPTE